MKEQIETASLTRQYKKQMIGQYCYSECPNRGVRCGYCRVSMENAAISNLGKSFLTSATRPRIVNSIR